MSERPLKYKTTLEVPAYVKSEEVDRVAEVLNIPISGPHFSAVENITYVNVFTDDTSTVSCVRELLCPDAEPLQQELEG